MAMSSLDGNKKRDPVSRCCIYSVSMSSMTTKVVPFVAMDEEKRFCQGGDEKWLSWRVLWKPTKNARNLPPLFAVADRKGW
jgi:hypothetical protein